MFNSLFGGMPPVVKNLLIINALMLLGSFVLESSFNYDLTQTLGLHSMQSEYFKPFQFVTHMFMHANFMHLFFNMYALWMFGKILEMVWGGKRFLFYYLVTGLGAAALHMFISWIEMSSFINEANAFISSPNPDLFYTLVKSHAPEFKKNIVDFVTAWSANPTDSSYSTEAITFVERLISETRNVPTVGASGAVYGVLLAFGMMFPNTPLMLLFIPVPIKAKYFVIGFGLIELFSGLSNSPGDNVAHFAHLGGMLFGFILIKFWWKKRNDNFMM